MENSVQQQTLELLIRQEMLLSGLYEVFAGQFPPYRRFWHEMSGDESRHASWLKQLAEAQKKEAVFFDHGKTNPRTLNTFIEHLENTILKAREGNLTLIQAVALALDFERSLIEKMHLPVSAALPCKTGRLSKS